MYGETFYGRHMAQHQLQWSQIKIRNEIRVYTLCHSFRIFWMHLDALLYGSATFFEF